MRHGEALANAKGIVSSWPEKFLNHLTKEGIEKARKAIGELKTKNINLIFSSDVARAKETAEVAGALLGINPEYDKRLREIDFGIFNSGPIEKFEKYFENKADRINKAVPGGESYKDVLERVVSFLEDINNKYKDKNILIISHQAPLFLLEGYVKSFSISEIIIDYPEEKMINKGEIRELN